MIGNQIAQHYDIHYRMITDIYHIDSKYQFSEDSYIKLISTV